jgi:hypothetical protein
LSEHEVIVLDREKGRLLVLQGIASEVWKRCDGERTVAAIADEIAAAMSVPRDPIRRDAAAAIEYLEREGLLVAGVAAGSVSPVEVRPAPLPRADRVGP